MNSQAHDSKLVRKKVKDLKRQRQLIEASITVISRLGLHRAKIQDIVDVAGVAAGMVNLHFETKENLLEETLKALIERQSQHWDTLANDTDTPNHVLLFELCCANFSFDTENEQLSAALMAFWGDQAWRKKYQGLMFPYLNARMDRLVELIGDISRDGGYTNIEPRPIAHALAFLAEGITVDGVIFENTTPIQSLKAVHLATLRALFPKHYDALGPVANPEG